MRRGDNRSINTSISRKGRREGKDLRDMGMITKENRGQKSGRKSEKWRKRKDMGMGTKENRGLKSGRKSEKWRKRKAGRGKTKENLEEKGSGLINCIRHASLHSTHSGDLWQAKLPKSKTFFPKKRGDRQKYLTLTSCCSG